MIHVVVGHVCAGKSTYVAANAAAGDVVVDMDRIALALTTDGTPHHDYPHHIADVAKAARWAAIDAAVRGHRRGGYSVWIIHAYPDDRDMTTYRRMGATIHAIEADAETLRRRAAAHRPERIRSLLAARLADECRGGGGGGREPAILS